MTEYRSNVIRDTCEALFAWLADPESPKMMAADGRAMIYTSGHVIAVDVAVAVTFLEEHAPLSRWNEFYGLLFERGLYR